MKPRRQRPFTAKSVRFGNLTISRGAGKILVTFRMDDPGMTQAHPVVQPLCRAAAEIHLLLKDLGASI